jgi:predicted nucleic-acid-binding protein
MIGLDTNILVRYLVKDSARQSAAATRLIKSLTPTDRGFISLPTLIETIWVLDSRYGFDKDRIHDAVYKLIHSHKLTIQNRDEVELALAHRGSFDIADAIIAQVGLAAGCTATMTFDKKAAKIEGMELLPLMY